jgi:hypothetical protein
MPEDEEEDVSSYWMTLRKRDDLRKFEEEALCAELALEEAMYLWQDKTTK